jgi:hypothetical protein
MLTVPVLFWYPIISLRTPAELWTIGVIVIAKGFVSLVGLTQLARAGARLG